MGFLDAAALAALPAGARLLERCEHAGAPLEGLYYEGDLSLLHSPIISIVGSRDMSLFTKNFTARTASALSSLGAVIASGGALGVDICAINAAAPRAIAVLPSGLGCIYPASNARALGTLAASGGLLLAENPPHHEPRKYDFLQRNRLVVGLADALIIAQAAPKSGSLNSASWAAKMHVPMHAIAQQAGASDGTMALVAKGAAGLIYDAAAFCEQAAEELGLSAAGLSAQDEVIAFIGAGCSFEEAYERFGELLYDYELDGKIAIDGALVRAK